MGWRGTLRTLQAQARRREREAAKQQRTRERELKQHAKDEAKALAVLEVEVFEAQMEHLLSGHKVCSAPIEWVDVLRSPKPVLPGPVSARTVSAQEALDSYRPNWLASLFIPDRREGLRAQVQSAVAADQLDTQENERSLLRIVEEWEADKEFASRILASEPVAIREVLDSLSLCGGESVLGASVDFECRGATVIASLRALDEVAVPIEEKRLLKSGKLSTKNIAKTKRLALHQDVVVGAALRIGREVFAASAVDRVVITASISLLESSSGHRSVQPVVSVAMDRETLTSLNFENLDPSDALSNFEHRQKFLKTKGFRSIKPFSVGNVE